MEVTDGAYSNKRLPIPEKWQRLPEAFFMRPDVVQVARELLGKIVITAFDGIFTAGRIVETEAYNGEQDKASHAFGGRRTNRTEVMYAAGGIAYVYLCYGLHHLFNVVTNGAGTPHAVLIRALEPVAGIEAMLLRTGKTKLNYTLTKGPGNVCKALGIHARHTAFSLFSDQLFIADDGYILLPSDIAGTPRIGVDYAGDDALLPYRFIIKGNRYVSGKKNKL